MDACVRKRRLATSEDKPARDRDGAFHERDGWSRESTGQTYGVSTATVPLRMGYARD